MPRLRTPKTKFWLTFALLVLLGIAATAVILTSRQHARVWFSPHPSFTKTSTATRLARLPHIVLWAWERPETLDHLDSSQVSVAFLARTLYLRADRVVVRPRLQPLTLPEGAASIAVARIESDRHEQPMLTPAQMSTAVQAIAELAELPGVVAVQVDYDATTSERLFYRNLLFELRKQIPKSTALTITALATWCKGDNWLQDLPIDEAVPMLFRMGVERNQILSQINSGVPFRSSKCQNSVGISTDEPVLHLPSTQRLFVFNPKPWSRTSVESLLRNHENEQNAP
jgi:hypothetical protein